MAQILLHPDPDAKLKLLILHILSRLGPMSAAELGTVLWKIDSEAYKKTGKSISGATYVRASD